MINIKRTDSTDPDFKALVALLDADLARRDGDEDHSFYAQFNKTHDLNNVIVCHADDGPAGCGAFKPHDEKQVEIKRMFVQPQHRGHGLGLVIVNELERWAVELGYTTCVLETGKNNPSAISLYAKAGYHIIPNYGQYANVETSVCMSKHLQKIG